MPADAEDDIILGLNTTVDVLRAREEARRLAAEIGLNTIDFIKVATAISEIANNAVMHATDARIAMRLQDDGGKLGLRVVVMDKGPGIANLEAALKDGYSTQRSLGIGLGAARRLMDEFDITSEVGKGTTVTMTKWKSA